VTLVCPVHSHFSFFFQNIKILALTIITITTQTVISCRAGSYYHRPGLSSRDDRHSTTLWAAACVWLRAGRIPLHSFRVHATQISLALVWRGTEGLARVAVLVVRRDGYRGAVPDVSGWR